MTASDGSPFTILVVCTGNICRSPQAAELIRKKIDESGEHWRSSVSVTSAGTHAVEGSAMDAPAAELLAAFGADATRHRAQQVTAHMIETADLVICMAREHRRTVARLHPASAQYSFLLTELTDLVDSAVASASFDGRGFTPASFSAASRPDALRAAVRVAASRRGLTPRCDPSTADVADPYQRSIEHYRASAERIRDCVEQLHRSAAAASQRSLQ